jgi:hypothetical protein
MSEPAGRVEPEVVPQDPTNGEGPPGMPRWVKVSALVVVVLLMLLVTVHLLTGGGPGHHMPVGLGAWQPAWAKVRAAAPGSGRAGWLLG